MQVANMGDKKDGKEREILNKERENTGKNKAKSNKKDERERSTEDIGKTRSGKETIEGGTIVAKKGKEGKKP